MSSQTDPGLEALTQNVLATPTARLPFQVNVLLRSYVLLRPAGNLIVYNSPGLNQTAAAITALGAPARLLINHEHEAMYGQPAIDVPIWIHRDDASAVSGSLDVAGTFDGPATIDDDLQVIPTPGHTPGTTSYLWDDRNHRYLFTGDFIWIEDGDWKAVVLDHDLRGAYLDSLALVRDLDFDVLVPWAPPGAAPRSHWWRTSPTGSPASTRSWSVSGPGQTVDRCGFRV